MITGENDMKKLLAILTVMTMVLTTLVVPTFANGNEGGDPGYVIPNNEIIITYNYYTESGQHNFYPISVTIGDINEETGEVALDKNYESTTLQQLVDNKGVALDDMHYQDKNLVFEEWVITGADIEMSSESGLGETAIGNCGGGFRVYATAKYEDGAAPVQTILSYYDENGDLCNEKIVFVVKDASNKTTEKAYNEMKAAGKLNVKHGDYGFIDWNYPNRDLIGEPDMGVSFYIQPLEIKATYSMQPVQVKCIYNNNGEVVTVEGSALVDTTDTTQNLYTGFEAFLNENKVPVEGVIGWAFNTNAYNNWQHEGQPQDEIMVAAVYEDYTPIYLDNSYVKCDSVDNMYYTAQDWETVAYVNSKYPDSIDPDGNDTYSEKAIAAIKTQYDDNPGELKLVGYKINGIEYAKDTVYKKDENSYLYCCAPLYGVSAIYDKVYVEIIGKDGSVTQKLWDVNQKYPLEGESTDLWNIEGANFGGDTIPGGSEVQLEAPFVKFSAWTLEKNPLEEVPEGLYYGNIDQLSAAMDDKVQGALKNQENGEVYSDYYDVTLFNPSTDAYVSNEDFPENGIWVTFEYPEGTDKNNTDFVISHMFTEHGNGYNAGDIEVITEKTLGKDGKPRLVKTDRCIKVLMYSLSPISVNYGDDLDVIDENQGGTTPGGSNDPAQPGTPGTTGAGTGTITTPDSSANTGDNFNMIPFIAIIMIAMAGVAAAMLRRKTVK